MMINIKLSLKKVTYAFIIVFPWGYHDDLWD